MSRRSAGSGATWLLALACCLLATGCSSGTKVPEASAADIDAAANAAQAEVNRYAAAQAASRRQIVPAVVTIRPVDAPQSRTPADPTVAPSPPIETGSAQEGADIVRRYYTLIASHSYGEAWRLWDDDGKASQQTEPAFEAAFADDADYCADIGTPGEIDAGAGQRYVTVPVKVHIRSKTGATAELAGEVVLHRVGDIDGATPAQRQWHIHGIDLKPAPTPAIDPAG